MNTHGYLHVQIAKITCNTCKVYNVLKLQKIVPVNNSQLKLVHVSGPMLRM